MQIKYDLKFFLMFNKKFRIESNLKKNLVEISS